MNWRLQIPWALVILRAALGPAVALAARLPNPEIWLGAMIVAGFLSDVYDGSRQMRAGHGQAIQ